MASKIQQIVVMNDTPATDEMGLVVRVIGGSSGGGNGAIEDGVNPAILATVFDLPNSNPQAVVIVDTNGDPIAGSAVSIADGADVAEGSIADVAVQGDNPGTVSAKLRGLNKSIAAGIPVTATNLDIRDLAFASDKVDASGSLVGALVTNAGGASAVNIQDGGNSITVDGSVAVSSSALPTGAATEATLATRLSESDYDSKTGSLTETPPATDTASSGLNGRLQRIAQRLTSLIASLPVSSFSVNHAPAANTKATITRAAAGGGIKNVCTGFTVSLAGQSTAPAAVQLSVALIDGASGGTTYLWGPQVIAIPAIAGATSAFVRSGIYIPGSANTAMTLEFSAAGGANTIESVSFEGTTTT